MRDVETIDSERMLVAALRTAVRDRSGPLPSIDVADALLDERRELTGLPPPDQMFGQSLHGTPNTPASCRRAMAQSAEQSGTCERTDGRW
jgi:hypothetical protein